MQRIQKTRSILEEKQIDAILIKSRFNKRYLSTLTGSGVKVLVIRDELYQIMNGRYSNEAREATSGSIPVMHEQGNNHLDEVARLLGGHARIGTEAGQALVEEYLSMQEYGLKIVLPEHELEEARRCKDAQGIVLVCKACEITDAIFQETISAIHIGMKKAGVSASLQYLAVKNGASAMAFDMIVVSGVRSGMSYGRPSEKTFEVREFITIDFDITYQGYQSDMTRTVRVQKSKPELKKIYDIVLEAQCAGVDFIKASIRGNGVDSHVRGIIQGYGYGPYFTHGLGHGIGIGGGELPLLNAGSDTVLEESMIMFCESGIYVPGLGGVRIEDDVLIESDRGVPLNTTTKELIILEGNGYEA